MPNKFLKFQQVLSSSEATDLLSSLTDEELTIDTLHMLVSLKRLTPIVGHQHLLVGFGMEQLRSLTDGRPAKPDAISEIGVPSLATTAFAGKWAAIATTDIDTPQLFFWKIKLDEDTGGAHLLESYQMEDLDSLDPFSPENWGFLTCDIYEIAKQANDQAPPAAMPEAKVPYMLLDNAYAHYPPTAKEIVGLSESYAVLSSGSRASRESSRSEDSPPPSYRLAVAALLELISKPPKSGRNQSGVIDEILERYPGKRGLSKRNLETIFASANKAAKEEL